MIVTLCNVVNKETTVEEFPFYSSPSLCGSIPKFSYFVKGPILPIDMSLEPDQAVATYYQGEYLCNIILNEAQI